MNHGLIERDLFHIRAAAASLEEIEEVILFGSRAKGTYRQGSDVDISIKGKYVTHSTVLKLSDDLEEERPLPYFFDIVDYNSLQEDDPLKQHIDRVGVVLFQASRILSNESND